MNAKNMTLILIVVAMSAGIFITINQQQKSPSSVAQVNVAIAPHGAWESPSYCSKHI